jgi:hypothetical protein
LSFHFDTSAVTNRPLGEQGDLYIDCDGVIVDYLPGIAEFSYAVTGYKPDPRGPKDFHFTEWLGLSCDAEMMDLVRRFNGGEGGHFARLPAMQGVVEVLQSIHQTGRGIHVLSSCSRDDRVVEMRHENLMSLCGDIFKSIICIDMHEDKSAYLSKFAHGYWVEDKFENAIKGAEQGHTSFLIRSPHNRKFEDPSTHYPFTWVDGWHDLKDYLI